MSITLRLDQIRIDGGTQPRATINEDVVKDYADVLQAGDNLPPVTVYRDGATHWLADGFHRWHATRKARGETGVIEADIREGTKRDAVLHSVAANATHGLRRSNDDKRKAVTTLLQDDEWQQWSDREIARQCNVSPHLVASVRDELSASTVQTHSAPDAAETPSSTRKSSDGRDLPAENPTAQAYEIETAIVELLNGTDRAGKQAVESLKAGWPDTAAIQRELNGKSVRKNLAKQARANVRQQIAERIERLELQDTRAAIEQGDQSEQPLASIRSLEMALRNYFGQHYRDGEAHLKGTEAARDGNAAVRVSAKRYLREMGHQFDHDTFQAALESRASIQADFLKRFAKAPDVDTAPPQGPEAATPAPDSPPATTDRSASIVASQKAYIERLEKRIKQLEGTGEHPNWQTRAETAERLVADLKEEITNLEQSLEGATLGREDPDLTGWLPPLTYPDAILAINAQLDTTTPGPTDPDHSLANRIDSYCQTLARATRDLEGMTPQKLIELIYSPAERLKGRPNTLKNFLQATDTLRRAHHEYATNPPTPEPA